MEQDAIIVYYMGLVPDGDTAGASPEGARSVDAGAIVLARQTLLALVDVLRAVNALVAWRTRAYVTAVGGRGVTQGAAMARIAGTGVVQVAQ